MFLFYVSICCYPIVYIVNDFKYIHTVEVTGSNPVSPTRIDKGLQALRLVSPFFMVFCRPTGVWMAVWCELVGINDLIFKRLLPFRYRLPKKWSFPTDKQTPDWPDSPNAHRRSMSPLAMNNQAAIECIWCSHLDESKIWGSFSHGVKPHGHCRAHVRAYIALANSAPTICMNDYLNYSGVHRSHLRLPLGVGGMLQLVSWGFGHPGYIGLFLKLSQLTWINRHNEVTAGIHQCCGVP